jgi:hypothetical protein
MLTDIAVDYGYLLRNYRRISPYNGVYGLNDGLKENPENKKGNSEVPRFTRKARCQNDEHQHG